MREQYIVDPNGDERLHNASNGGGICNRKTAQRAANHTGQVIRTYEVGMTQGLSPQQTSRLLYETKPETKEQS